MIPILDTATDKIGCFIAPAIEVGSEAATGIGLIGLSIGIASSLSAPDDNYRMQGMAIAGSSILLILSSALANIGHDVIVTHCKTKK